MRLWDVGTMMPTWCRGRLFAYSTYLLFMPHITVADIIVWTSNHRLDSDDVAWRAIPICSPPMYATNALYTQYTSQDTIITP